MRAERQPSSLDTLRRFGRAHRRYLAQGLVGTMGVVLFRLAIPWPLRGVVEYAFPNGTRHDTVLGLLPAWGEPLFWLCGAYLLCAVCGGLSETAQRVSMVRFASRTVGDLRSAALQTAARRFRGVRAAAGDLIARLVADAGRLRSDLTGILVHASKDALLFFGVSALFLLWISPTMGVFFLVGGALTGWVGYLASRPVEAAARRARHDEGALATTIEQTLERGHLVPLAAADPGDDEGGGRGARSTKILGDASVAVHALLGVTVCLAVWTGVGEVRAGELAPGELFLFIAYALMVHRRLVDGGRQLARVGKVRASVERLAPLLDAPGGEAGSLNRPLRSGVRVERLRVDAVKGRRPRLDDIDLEVLAGSRVAVIGRPGAGKSTLLRSLAGLEHGAQGTLRWDGEELAGLDALLRTGVGYLPHDPVFPPAPAWHLLGLSGPEALESTQVEMLRSVGAWKFVERSPRGLRQKVSSATVSRNEARALVLGSVLLGDTPLIALDSPFEGLKKRTALKRLQAVASATAGRTLIMALPRLSDANLFDRVVVLRRGRVAFDGSPQDWRAWKATRRRKEVAACRA